MKQQDLSSKVNNLITHILSFKALLPFLSSIINSPVSRYFQVNLKSLIINLKLVLMEENKEEIPSALPVKLGIKKAGRPALKLKGKELILHQKELKKRRYTKYHQRRKNGELSNPASLENRKRRYREHLKKLILKIAPKLILN